MTVNIYSIAGRVSEEDFDLNEAECDLTGSGMFYFKI